MDKTGYNKDKENAWNIIINSKSFEEMENSLKNIFEVEAIEELMKPKKKLLEKRVKNKEKLEVKLKKKKI